jgi:glycosyltransferase involved in cell wall biosynthesis
MLIAIDGNEANVKQRVGVSMYTYELLKYFSTWANKETRFTVILRNIPQSDMPRENEYFKYHVVPGVVLWRDLFLPIHLMLTKEKPDVFFSPAHYAPRFTTVPLVVTIHDVSYLYYPNEFLKKDLYKLKNWTQQAMIQAKKIIAVSEFTKKDIVKNYAINPEKIIAIHNGFNTYQQSEKTKQENKDPYILYVGTLQPRKNIETLIHGFNEIIKEKNNLKLVLVGKKGWMYESLFALVKKLDLEDKIDLKGYVTNEELEKLYNNATLFIMPSLYEGFGIPILEAMSHGVPVLAATGSSLVEIGGDACAYFNPHDTMELKRKILEMIHKPELTENLGRKGLERIKKFSWEKCARETLGVLQSI